MELLLRVIGLALLATILLPVTLFLFLLFSDFKTRSVSLPIDANTELEFTVVWNMGLDQYLRLYRNGKKFAEKYEEVFKRPYWSGGPVFASRNRDTYFVVLGKGAYEISIAGGQIVHNCELSSNAIASLDYLGELSVVMPLKHIPGQHGSSRGEDVRFTPARQVPPNESSEVARQRGYKTLCG
jgi:hypothetical protein